ncbi:MAG: dockerin type I domain-containing protein [Planctomycetota bacterium]|jgi:hypothetical protein
MQNTIVKEFENDPRVAVTIISQSASVEELETFWRNVYLRGRMLYDPDNAVCLGLYDQPFNGMPASRGFLIGPDRKVAGLFFSHDPQRVIDEIQTQLDAMPPIGDVNADGTVNFADLLALLAAWGPCGATACPADLNHDYAVDTADLMIVLGAWTR